jgi:transposase
MAHTRINVDYPDQVKEEAPAFVRERGYLIADATKSPRIIRGLPYRWKEKCDAKPEDRALPELEHEEFSKLR